MHELCMSICISHLASFITDGRLSESNKRVIEEVDRLSEENVGLKEKIGESFYY